MSRRRAPSVPLLTGETASIHYDWKRIPVWRTVYSTGKGGVNKRSITVWSLTKPPDIRWFKTGRGRKKYYAVHQQRSIQGFVVQTRNILAPTIHGAPINPNGDLPLMAKTTAKRSTRKARAPEVTDVDDEDVELDDDLEAELAALEDADSLIEDEDTEEDDADELDDDDAPAPRAKRSRRPQKSRAAANGKVGTREVAEFCDVTPRTLRMVLRNHRDEFPKDEDSGRYEWDSLDDPGVRAIKKFIDAGEAKDIQNRSLAKLKKDKESKKGDKKSKKNKKKVVEEDEDDE